MYKFVGSLLVPVIAVSCFFLGQLMPTQIANSMAINVDGMGPKDLFACIYLIKNDLNIDAAYVFAENAMSRRKR